MFKRAVGITVIAVSLGAAAASAFMPALVRASERWGFASTWTGPGYTPDPRSRSYPMSVGDPLQRDEGGMPGTYCPVRSHDDKEPLNDAGGSTPTEPAMGPASSPVAPASEDSLQLPAQNCAVPVPSATEAKSPAPKPLLP
jgi:hypothetical protein